MAWQHARKLYVTGMLPDTQPYPTPDSQPCPEPDSQSTASQPKASTVYRVPDPADSLDPLLPL